MESRDMLKQSLLEKTLTLLESSRPVELEPVNLLKKLSILLKEKVQQVDTKIFDNSLFSLKGFTIHLHSTSLKENQ